MQALKDLTESDFNLFRRLIYDQSGISLNPSKRELLRTRLRSRLEREKFSSYREYYKFVVADKTGQALVPLLDDISTNLTSFYREINHFNYLNEILPEWIKRKQGERDNIFRIWSAGCSTGEEPYTIAFTMLSHLSDKAANMSLKILATDLSTDVLKKASEGVYRLDRMRDVPANVKRNYFIGEQGEKNSLLVRVHPMVRELITFRRCNLMSEQFPFKNKFDFIFCRNVMIYFDKPTQETLVAKYYGVLKPGGYLFIGHSESLTTIKHSYDYIMPTVYRK
ncbi:MAG: CheR family methyltransferase [Nitrospinota bacterium]